LAFALRLLAGPSFAFETRIAGFISRLDSSEEGFERSIQPAKYILKHLRKDTIEIAIFLLRNQHGCLIFIGSTDAFNFIDILPICQCLIIEIPASIQS